MKKRKYILGISMLVLLMLAGLLIYRLTSESVQKGLTTVDAGELWNSIMSKTINKQDITLNVDGTPVAIDDAEAYMSDNMVLMIPANVVTEAFNCAENLYDDTRLVIEKGTSKAVLTVETGKIKFDGKSYKLGEKVVEKDGVIYIPITVITDYFGYEFEWDSDNNIAKLTNNSTTSEYLPPYYSYIEQEKCPNVKDQGTYGTCWAFATLTAMESALLPEEKVDFSEDHLTLNNNISTNQDEGGEYTMALAYLAAWQGPVYEEDDPYGDNETNRKLKAVKHVQEVQIIESKDYQQIKEMIYKYGGVQSSLYTSLQNSNSTSVYYNREKYAYCYIGDKQPNHDIVIVGWDDEFPKEYFNDSSVKNDGAFICRNSWGSDFGDNGTFYVSYEDTNIGVNNVCYTGIEAKNNYDNIYQSDLCGWIGTMGFKNQNRAYFSNVYTSKKDEKLEAVSFYATAKDTQYQVYVCTNYINEGSLNNRSHIAATGIIENSGYYTIKLDQEYTLKEGQKFAIIVKAYSPNTTKPIAVEMKNEDFVETINLEDGEGYFSYDGKAWQRAEDKNCNICLKAFTSNK